MACFQAPGRPLVRGGGRLGWLEGVPFQTLRIDLFVDGAPSLHPLLVVVDHVLKLFQRSSFLSAPRLRSRPTRQLANPFSPGFEGRGRCMYNGEAPREGVYGEINRMIISLAISCCPIGNIVSLGRTDDGNDRAKSDRCVVITLIRYV